MHSRDILEQQDLEYSIALMNDIEREEQENRIELERIDNEQNELQDKSSHNETQDETEVINPSPKTLRNIRQAFFENIAKQNELPETHQTQPNQTQPPRGRLRSGRSY